ncbi:MAG: hypothetical protein ACJAZN_000069 [Planctomycetota bacterium]
MSANARSTRLPQLALPLRIEGQEHHPWDWRRRTLKPSIEKIAVTFNPDQSVLLAVIENSRHQIEETMHADGLVHEDADLPRNAICAWKEADSRPSDRLAIQAGVLPPWPPLRNDAFSLEATADRCWFSR